LKLSYKRLKEKAMIEPAPGILLIADPFLKDPNFVRSVIFLCEHEKQGSFGFVLNRQIEQTLDELLNSFDGHQFPVYYGGPVQTDTIHFLHQYPDAIKGGNEVMKGVYWGGDFEKLTYMIQHNLVTPDKIRFFIGYSGWSSGQLGTELKEKTWLTASATRKIVFNEHPENTWKESLEELGGEYKMMANFPIDPQLN
jgi:putative transcriptional regulator